ncbi:hypothetical protein MMC25_006128 [Agyrium rufum]|nr:hypothetical protein [Agyrium rufum]
MAPFTPSILLILGALLLIHATYSTYEHSLLPRGSASLPSTASTSLPSKQQPTTVQAHALPTDIVLETLLSIILLCVGIVTYSTATEPLKNVQWRKWAADVDHGVAAMKGGTTGSDGVASDSGSAAASPSDGGLGDGMGPGGVYAMLEKGRRRGFLDVRAQRKEFAEWVRKGGKEDVDEGRKLEEKL